VKKKANGVMAPSQPELARKPSSEAVGETSKSYVVKKRDVGVEGGFSNTYSVKKKANGV
jgi:hypothetical protein